MSGRVVVLAGPPCAGKTTYAREHALAGDEILDYDIVFAELSGLPLYERAFGQAEAVGAEFQRRLMRIRQGFVIRCAPDKQHRAILRRTRGATSIVLAVPAAFCHARLRASDRPDAVKQGLHEAIDEWWDDYEPSSSPDETVLVEADEVVAARNQASGAQPADEINAEQRAANAATRGEGNV